MPRRLFQTPHEWPLERVEAFCGLVKLGLTAKQIARELGISAAAVVAKGHRMGLKITQERPRPSAPTLLTENRAGR
jgi:hypothetical protein